MKLAATENLKPNTNCPTIAFDQQTALYCLYFAGVFTALFFIERGVRTLINKRKNARKLKLRQD